MRVCTMAIVGFLATFGTVYGQPEGVAQEPEVSVRDYDQQIGLLKQEITKYTTLANQFDRKATQLRSRDFSGYRNACELRDRCREIAIDLQKHLELLEKRENEFIESQKKVERE
jgi:hypothetical protein